MEARAFGTSRADVVWTSAPQAVQPWMIRRIGSGRRPIVLDLDWTLAQQERLAPWYYNRDPRTGAAFKLARLREALVWKSTTVFIPWSNWAADSLKDQGVDGDRIRIIPPGLDLDLWRYQNTYGESSGPLRLLFVGNDFRRKGGDLLLEAVRSAAHGTYSLDIVTGDEGVVPDSYVHIHRVSPNSVKLMSLYHKAELFVMPSRAECFGIAYVEALASGVPVVAGDSGGIRDIVRDGETGWIVPPTTEAVTRVLTGALVNRPRLRQMGAAGRADVEEKFDGNRNARRLVDEMLRVAGS